MKSFAPPTDEIVDQTLRSLKRELERNYFFGKLENPYWITFLESRGVFKYPPKAIRIEDRGIQFPFWPELEYIVRMVPVAGADAVRIAQAVPSTDNPRVYHQILQIAIAVKDVTLSVKLLDKLVEYADAPHHLIGSDFALLLRLWATGDATAVSAAINLARHLVEFRPDPRQKEKIAERKTNPASILSQLEPCPKFDSWDYMSILREGVNPLGAAAPVETGIMLIEAISDMIRLKIGGKKFKEKDYERDGSIFWCRRVSVPSGPHVDPDEALVHTLTSIFEGALMADIDGVLSKRIFSTLSNGHWNVFARIGNYLAGLRPKAAPDWIKKAVLDFKEYSSGEYAPEFVEMVHKATEGGTDLFAENELTPIFEAILSGPNKQRYIDYFGDKYTEEAFKLRQRGFHKSQLWQFEGVLFGKYKQYFEELCRDEKPTLQDYGPSLDMWQPAKVVQSQSPIAKEDLARKSDEDLITFLNGWNDAHHEPTQWWIEIDHKGLSQAFQSVILENPARFAKWDKEWEKIKRPVYFRAAIEAATKSVEQKNLTHLGDWFRLAEIIVSKNNPVDVPRNQLSDDSDTQPDWDWTRRGVDSFLQVCLKQEAAIPHSWRNEAAGLLTKLATSYDSILDQNREVFVGTYDPIGTAINTTRGQSLERITDFINWIGVKREPNAFSQVPEITELLKARFNGNPPLTEPEYAILGESFNRFFYWDGAWTTQYLRAIFVHDEDLKKWRAAFITYLRFSRAYGEAFAALKADYDLALANMDLFRKGEHDYHTPAEGIGHHLFSFYAGGQFSLNGDDSLLEAFYRVSSPRECAGVMNFVGRSLAGQPETPAEIIERCRIFFEHRLALAEQNPTSEMASEFSSFEPWIQAANLDPIWRLKIAKRVLGLPVTIRSDSLFVQALKALLNSNVGLVVECFALLVAKSSSKESFYVPQEEATLILQTGLASNDETIKQAALRAQDNLLRTGRFEFLDLSPK